MKLSSMRWLTAIVLVLALALAGCTTGPQRGTLEPSTEPAQETTLPETETTEPEATEPEATEPEATESEDGPVSLGRMEGGTYTNTYAGFACDLDASWSFLTAEELQELPQKVQDALDGSDISDSLEDMQQITDMMAENTDLLTTVNVQYTKLDLQSRLAYQLLSDEEILDAVLESKDTLISTYAQAGINVSTLEKAQVTFLGEECWAMKTTAETQGVPYYILQVFNYRAGSYGVVLTCSSYVEDQTQTVLDLFYPAN